MRYLSRSPTPVDFGVELSGEALEMLGEMGGSRRRLRTACVRSEGDASEGFDDLADEEFGEFFDRT